MEKEEFSGVLTEALDGIRSYILQQLTYNKLVLSKKMTELSSQLILYTLLLFSGSFMLLFLSFAFADWYATKYGDAFVGYLILAGFYLLIGIVVYLLRKPLFVKPIRRVMGNMFFSDEDESDISSNTFISETNLDIQIQKALVEVEMEEEALKMKFQDVGKLYSLPNLVEHFVKNAVQSVATITNVAKFSYKLVQKLIPKKNKNKKLKD